MNIQLHEGDLPTIDNLGDMIAIDTETTGLSLTRDRLCLVQISTGDGNAHLVRIASNQTSAPNIVKILNDKAITKIFHFARFDMAVLYKTFAAIPDPVYCTKIASKIARTYTDLHGLKALTRELTGTEISKKQQSSYWGGDTLSEAQLKYAAMDVVHLHNLRTKLNEMLEREGRYQLLKACLTFLPARVMLDIMGWQDCDIFSH